MRRRKGKKKRLKIDNSVGAEERWKESQGKFLAKVQKNGGTQNEADLIFFWGSGGCLFDGDDDGLRGVGVGGLVDVVVHVVVVLSGCRQVPK